MNQRYRYPIVVLLAAMALFIVVFTWLATARYHALFSYDPRDEAVNNQILTNTAHGHLLRSTVKGEMIFHRHFRPIFLPLSLPYLIQTGPPTFYLTVAVILALGAWFAFLLGRQLFNDNRLALLAGLWWLLFPPVHELMLGNFDPETIAATFWLGAFVYFRARRAKPFWLLALLAVCCKETHAPILVIFGLLALWERRRWTWIIPPIAVGIAWFTLAVWVIIPLYCPDFHLVLNRLAGVENTSDFWGEFLGAWRSPGRMLARMLNPEDGYLFAKLLLATGGLALLSPFALAGGGMTVAQILLLKEQLPVRQTHILAGLTPFLFAAGLIGLGWLAGKFKRKSYFTVIVLNVLILWSVLSAFLAGPFGPHRLYDKEDYLPTTLFEGQWRRVSDSTACAWEMIRAIPQQAPVMTNERYLLPLSSRAEIFEFGTQGLDLDAYARADWILLGLDEMRCPTCTYALWTPESLGTAMELIRSGRFVVQDATDRLVLLRRQAIKGTQVEETTTRAVLNRLSDYAAELAARHMEQ